MVHFPVTEAPSLPAVCAKTGEPAAELVEVQAYRRPAMPLLLGWLWAAGLYPLGRRTGRTSLKLPFRPEVADGYRRWRWVVTVVMAVGAGLVVGGSWAFAPLVPVGSGLACLAALGWYLDLLAHTCGVYLSGDGSEVTVTRCHPGFRQAVERSLEATGQGRASTPRP